MKRFAFNWCGLFQSSHGNAEAAFHSIAFRSSTKKRVHLRKKMHVESPVA